MLDISLLVAAESKTRIPVSCVEQGRWDGGRHREAFTPSRQTADPELRKLKNRRVRERVAAGGEARADQGEVWSAVASRMSELDAPSPTGAMSDLYERRRDSLDSLREPIALHDGQIGAVCAIGGRISILDLVGRADVWSDLHPALIEGYALDALRYENIRGAAAVRPRSAAAASRGAAGCTSSSTAPPPPRPTPSSAARTPGSERRCGSPPSASPAAPWSPGDEEPGARRGADPAHRPPRSRAAAAAGAISPAGGPRVRRPVAAAAPVMASRWTEFLGEPTFRMDERRRIYRSFPFGHTGVPILGERFESKADRPFWALHHPAALRGAYEQVPRERVLDEVIPVEVVDAPPALASFPGADRAGSPADRVIWLENAVEETLGYFSARAPGSSASW